MGGVNTQDFHSEKRGYKSRQRSLVDLGQPGKGEDNDSVVTWGWRQNNVEVASVVQILSARTMLCIPCLDLSSTTEVGKASEMGKYFSLGKIIGKGLFF